MKKKMSRNTWGVFSLIILGVSIIAIAYNSFLNPAQINSGSVAGLATVLNEFMTIKVGYIIFLANVPVLVWCYVYFGLSVSIRTLLGGLLQPALVLAFEGIPVSPFDNFVNAVLGGTLTGVGVSILYYANASTGGSAAIALIISHMKRLNKGFILFLIDGSIVLSSLIVFPGEKVLYSFLSVFCLTCTVTIIQKLYERLALSTCTTLE
ncbi:YitT family protein [Enterococcus casseliflavus]|uniref:YitT family protein n=1 Tax=Enterococcus casseliflavus TaxID=37734 RepID=UPI0039A559F5